MPSFMALRGFRRRHFRARLPRWIRQRDYRLHKEAEQYVAKGNLKAAEIELRNAIRESHRTQSFTRGSRKCISSSAMSHRRSARRVRPANVTQ